MLGGRPNLRFRAVAILLFSLFTSYAVAEKHATVEELKSKIASANVADRSPLCLQLSEQQVKAAGQSYKAGDSAAAKADLADVVTFSEMARDSALESHKHEKESEIAIRKMARKLADIKHVVLLDDQTVVQNAVDRLQGIRDDLLKAMFPKGGK